MGFILIKGTFHVVGYSPDGDSVKFKAAKKANWSKLKGPKVELNKKDLAQLRFEAIDAPETHYHGHSQPEDIANKATDFTLKALNIKDVVWGPKHSRVISAKDGTPGYILSRTAERYKRPVAFVFAGNTNRTDGSEVYMDANLLKKSMNYQLALKGMAYPTYYEGLFYDLRMVITQAVKKARASKAGIWKIDKTSGLTINSLKTIKEDHLILPKLFRRISDYLKNHASVIGFDKYMFNNPEDVLILGRCHFTHFDYIINQTGKKIGLEVLPEDLVFNPDEPKYHRVRRMK